MQKYTPLKDQPSGTAVAVTTVNGYNPVNTIDSTLSTTMDTIDNNASAKHYNNKTNMAKLQWWHAPTPRISLDMNSTILNPNERTTMNGVSATPNTETGLENENVLSGKNLAKHLQQHQNQNQYHHQQHHHSPYRGKSHSETNASPLSKSASSSRHKIHNLSVSSIDRLSNKIPHTNQFSIEEEQDQNKQDSQLLLNGKFNFILL